MKCPICDYPVGQEMDEDSGGNLRSNSYWACPCHHEDCDPWHVGECKCFGLHVAKCWTCGRGVPAGYSRSYNGILVEPCNVCEMEKIR